MCCRINMLKCSDDFDTSNDPLDAMDDPSCIVELDPSSLPLPDLDCIRDDTIDEVASLVIKICLSCCLCVSIVTIFFYVVLTRFSVCASRNRNLKRSRSWRSSSYFLCISDIILEREDRSRWRDCRDSAVCRSFTWTCLADCLFTEDNGDTGVSATGLDTGGRGSDSDRCRALRDSLAWISGSCFFPAATLKVPNCPLLSEPQWVRCRRHMPSRNQHRYDPIVEIPVPDAVYQSAQLLSDL